MFNYDSFLLARKNKPCTIIECVDALCAQGKTTSTLNCIAQDWGYRRVVVVAPTIRLIEEISSKLDALKVSHVKINNETVDGNVQAATIEELQNFERGVVLLTWQTFVNLDPVNYSRQFLTVIDELPAVDNYLELKVPRSRCELRDRFHTKRVTNRMYQLVLRDADKERHALKAPLDDLDSFNNKDYRQLIRHLATSRYDAFVMSSQWDRLIENGEFTGSRPESQRIGILKMLNPLTFRGCCFLGANIRRSLFGCWIECHSSHGGQKFKLIDEPSITGSLLPPLDLRSRVEIRYLLPGSNASKYAFEQRADDDETLLGKMEREVINYFGNDTFLYVKNKSAASLLDELPNKVDLPPIANGLNEYEHHTNIAIVAAYNRNPQHIRMLKELNISDAHINASAHEQMYQQVMRTALRKPGSNEQVRIILPDEASARYVAEALGTDRIEKLGGIVVKKRPPLLERERKRRSKFKTVRKKLLRVGFVGTALEDADEPIADVKVFLTTHETTRTADPDEHFPQQFGVQEFIRMMRTCAAAPLRKKDEGCLINPCLFDPEIGGKGFRTKENFYAASFAVLDFDDGPVTPDDVVAAFHHNAGRGRRLPFIICNSFSRRNEQPNRFRVFVFYKTEAVRLSQHQAAIRDLITQLEDAGLAVKESLDAQCSHGVQSFYAPCTNAAYPEAAFFECFNMKSSEIRRYGLDPVELESFSPKPVLKPRPSVSRQNKKIDWGVVENKISHLRSMKEDRHRALWDLTWDLRKMGLDEQQCLEQMLSISSEPKMVKKVNENVAKVYSPRK